MGRDTASAAGNNSTAAQGMSSSYGGQALANTSILTPTLNKMITAPQGFGQNTINNMTTAAMQSAGGSQAGIVGGANQRAAATNNAGAFDGAISQAGRDASNQLSDAALNVQNQNAMLQEQQREQGLSGLEGLYNTNVNASQNALGLSDQALGVQNAADQQTASNWMNPLDAALPAAASFGTSLLQRQRQQQGCWIAATLWGSWHDPRTVAVRQWIFGPFAATRTGALVARLYLRFGERIAERIKTNRLLRWVFQRVFNVALRKAEEAK